jgi:hypothetical protein
VSSFYKPLPSKFVLRGKRLLDLLLVYEIESVEHARR